MALVKWGPQYSVGIDRIDDQHKIWIELINALHDAMSQGKGHEIVARVYKEMIDYTRTHFGEEERLMRATGFPGYAAHKALHDQFIRDIGTRLGGEHAGAAKATLDTMSTLRDWLVNHIQKTDRAFVPHFLGNGVD